MKKLIVFMVAFVAAIMTQAAALDWQYTGTASDVGQTVYLCLGETAVTEWDSVAALADAALDSATLVKSGRTYFAKGSTMSDSISKSGTSVYFVVVSADGESYGVTAVEDMTASVYDPAAQESTPGANDKLTSSSLTVTGKSFGGNPPPVDTPEPTSGLLLLVGGAALALRRKQK